MEANPIIAIVGGLNIDFILETDRIPDLGESKDALSSGQYHGGKGANTAVAALRASHNRPKEGLRPTLSPSDLPSAAKYTSTVPLARTRLALSWWRSWAKKVWM
jgi:hypothetical protein